MVHPKHRNTKWGAVVYFLLFALLFLLLIGRFFYIQYTGQVAGNNLAIRAEELYTKKRTILAERGTIVDRNGNIMAEEIPTYTIAAVLDPEIPHVKDARQTAEKLAPFLKMSESDIYERLTRKKLKQVEFGRNGRNLSQATKTAIDNLKLPGITFMRETKRFYPNGDFASYVLGYVRKNPTDEQPVGQLGVESYYNKALVKKDGYVQYLSDKQWYQLPGTTEKITHPQNGKDVVLTIDKTIQAFVEDAMKTMVKKYAPEKAIAIIADAKTGEIIAMSTKPSYDPNKRNFTNYLNDAISYRYEPGSTMKIFTLAAAIDSGVFRQNDTFASGVYRVGPDRISDANKVGWGRISFLEGVQRSSNVGFAILANEKIGTEQFRQYLTKFGLDKPTGIDLPDEVSSLFAYRYPLEKVTTAFGQGTALTPIQQIQAATAIANGGKMMKPFVVKELREHGTNKVVKQTKPTVVGEPIRATTAAEVLRILETVVSSENGTGKAYQIPGYKVAGKTGTAQIPNPRGRGYLTGHRNYFFSFLGMAPADDPRLIMYVAVKQPKINDNETGSAPISLVFNPVMKNSLKYLNIEPANKVAVQKAESKKTIGQFVNLTVAEAKERASAHGVQAVLIGDGNTVLEQSVAANDVMLAGEKLLLLTDVPKMPAMKGWSKRDCLRFARMTGVKLSYSGTGFVARQSVAPGTALTRGEIVVVKLLPPSEKEVPARENKNQILE